MSRFFHITLLLLLALPLRAQQVLVKDQDTGTPLPNVAIYNADRSRSTLTNESGIALLDVFEQREKITFDHPSYKTVITTVVRVVRRGRRVYMERKPEELQEVVMSVSRWEQQRKDIPQKLATITAQGIAFNQPQTAADVLAQSGKVFVQKSQLGGGSPMIRGFSTNRLLITVDGVRMNNAIFRGGNLQNVISIDPYTIRNTEVVFGPGSVIYGSDAIGGVMNFFTKNPRLSYTDSLTVSGQVDYRFSSASNEQTGHVELNLGHQHWASLTSFTVNSFGDLRMGRNGPDEYLRPFRVQQVGGQDQLVANEDPLVQSPTGYTQYNFLQKVFYKPNAYWNYDLGIRYSTTTDFPRYDRLIRPNSAGDGLRSAEWYYGPQQWLMANTTMTHKAKNAFYRGMKFTAAYQQFRESRNNRDFGDPSLFKTEEKVDALSLNLDLEHKRKERLRLYYGLGYVWNGVESVGTQIDQTSSAESEIPSRYTNGAEWQSIAGYVNSEFKWKPNLSVLGGMRYSHVLLKAPFDDRFFDFPFEEANVNSGAFTASLGLSWLPRADWQVTLNGSTGFRAPNIDDIGKIFDSEPGAVVVPNPDLESEYAYNLDFGIRKNIKDRWVISASGFYTYLVDALVRRDFEFNGQNEILFQGELSRVQAIQNAAKAFVYGAEFGVEGNWGEHWQWRSNLTYTRGREEDDNGMESASRHAAPLFGDAHLIWNNDRFKSDFFVVYNGEISYENLALSERSKSFLYATDAQGNPFSPSWYTLNWRNQYRFRSGLVLSLSAENITDQRYRPYSSGISGAGFNLVAGASFRF